jgi:hypothetical protein
MSERDQIDTHDYDEAIHFPLPDPLNVTHRSFAGQDRDPSLDALKSLKPSSQIENHNKD